MAKLFGLCCFVAGLAAVYMWGIRPLSQGSPTASGNPIAITSRGQPTPLVLNGDQRGVEAAARAFLDRWQAGQFSAMYDLLTAQAQQRISRGAFVTRYGNVLAEATVQQVQAAVRQVHVTMPEATVAFTDTFTTRQLGAIQQANTMHLVLLHGRWGVDWYPALIFKQLEDPYVVHLVSLPAKRGAILDRSGVPLAEDGNYWTVGVVPGNITDEPLLLSYLSKWLHMSSTEIKHLYTLSWAQPDYFMPITTITDPQLQAAPPGFNNITSNDGVALQSTGGRIYPQGSVASILVGYVDHTTRHGVAGLEKALDPVLTGQDGLQLAVMNRAHTLTVAVIAGRPAVNGRDVRLTIDLAAQRAAEKQLGIRPGAAVAIDPATGAVLALASTPDYDPNRFEIGATATRGIGPIRSTFPRATLGTYPIGSIFKIVTMAAALEHGGYT
ncbi:MAG TPA: NTF2-like N-terminal transpeptidase domain-containing protein, partial [Chloroflexota bacterium]|nr:NTF2-like N-terminal transpeptidase domain-containing protein [Chloroflexota bacterium]